MQTETGNRYAITALKDKRASLAGEVIQLKKKLEWAESQLRHVDATLALFDPKGDPNAIPAKRPRKHVKLFRQGELNRLILDALRTADGPQRTQDIVSALLIALGHDENARTALAPRVRGNLQYLLREKQAVAKIGGGRDTRWALSP